MEKKYLQLLAREYPTMECVANAEREELANLIYYPEKEIKYMRKKAILH